MAASSIPLPECDSIKIDAADWQAGAEPGEALRPLIDDPRGYRTFLSRVPAGPLGARHAHDEIEQIYVLEGDFYDDDADYGPGDFVLRMPGAIHRAGSRNGCTMLIVYAPLVEMQR
ncbi:MAG: cupin domain-containing protein [Sphingomonadales bacterium]|nr:cupin domain-containing protein [Sphingomonadales bacterium]